MYKLLGGVHRAFKQGPIGVERDQAPASTKMTRGGEVDDSRRLDLKSLE